MEKLLFLGVDTSTAYAVNYAKKSGAWTIISDYLPKDSNPVKKLADEIWQIDLKDLDRLERQCRQAGVTGVYSGNNEFCLDQTRLLAKRLGLPFYATDKSWEWTLNKNRFKDCCQRVGLDVPRQYAVTLEHCTLPEEAYPVLVKPVDGGGSMGISVCRNEEELRAGIERALAVSEIKEVVVEDFIQGPEVAIFYYFINEKAVIDRVFELMTYPNTSGTGRGWYYFLHSTNTGLYDEVMDGKLQQLFQMLDCKAGIGFIQAILRDGKYYIIEMNYRIEGSAASYIQMRSRGRCAVEYMVDYALGRDLTKKQRQIIRQAYAEQNGECAIYMPVMNPGKIQKISGLKEIEAMDGVDTTPGRYKEGDEVLDSGDMYQLACSINIWAENWEQMAEKMRTINQTFHITDEQGRELLTYYEDYETMVRIGKNPDAHV